MNKKKKTCPSAPSDIADNIIGITDTTGKLQYFSMPIKPTKMDKSHSTTRFSTTCIGQLCKHWQENGCSWPKILLSHVGQSDSTRTQYCNVRSSCRWRFQEGDDICARCPAVMGTGITN